MKKTAIITFVIAITIFSAYAYLQPQSLKRQVGSDLELIPSNNLSSVIVLPSLNLTIDKMKSKEWFKKAVSNGLMDDFYDYVAFRMGVSGMPSIAFKMFKGKLFWDLLGDGMVVASYDDGEKIFITHPKEDVRLAWRGIVKDGQRFSHSGYHYYKTGRVYLSFAGNLFIATASEPKMWAVLERMAQKTVSIADELSLQEGVYAYGLLNRNDFLLTGKVFFSVDSKGMKLILNSPDGVFGRPLIKAKPAGKLPEPANTAVIIGFKKIDFSTSEDFLRTSYPNYISSLEENAVEPIFPLLKGKMNILIDGFTKDYYSVPEFAIGIGLTREGKKKIDKVMRGYISEDQTLLNWGVENGNLILWNSMGLKRWLKTSRRHGTISHGGLFMVVNLDRLGDQLSEYLLHVSRYSEFASASAIRAKSSDVLRSMLKGTLLGSINNKDRENVILNLTVE